MRICRFSPLRGEWLWGELIQNEVRELRLLRDDSLSFVPGERVFALPDCRLLAPVLPTQLVGIGDNFRKGDQDHLVPVVFEKPLSSLVPNHSEVHLPENADVWGEPEIGVVIKKFCKDLGEFDIEDYVLGHCLINDTTALFRTHKHDSHTREAKGQRGFCQIGDFISTEFDYENAVITGKVNGSLYRQGPTRQMKWDLKKVLREVTATRSLRPGDIVFTGAPERVQQERTFLRDGDEFEVFVEGLGSLRTLFRKEA